MANLRYLFLCVATASAVVSASALDANRYSTRSRLSSGKWVKIKVDRTGMQQITFDQLRQWGFSDPSKVSVFGYGGAYWTDKNTFNNSLADDLMQTASIVSGDKIIFYGEGTQRLTAVDYNQVDYVSNVYDIAGYYFLSDSEDRKSLTTKAFNKAYNNNNLFTDSYASQIYQPDNVNYMDGGSYWLGPYLSTTEDVEVSFDMEDFGDTSSLKTFGLMGFTFTAKAQQKQTVMEITAPEGLDAFYKTSGICMGIDEGSEYFNVGSGYWRFRGTEIGSLDNRRLTFKYRLPETTEASIANLKRIWLVYPRVNDMRGNVQMELSCAGNSLRQNLSIISDNQLMIWNVSNPLDIYVYETAYDDATGTTRATFDKQFSTSSIEGRMLAFDPDGQLYTPTFAGNVANQNIHGDVTPNMVIVTTNDLLPQAEELAQMHRDRGYIINVYTHQQVLNEFSSGTQTPQGYRMMNKMFYDRDPETFKAMLLYGPSTWDFRSIQRDTRDSEQLLTFLVDKEAYVRRLTSNFSTDLYFGMLADNYSHTNIEYQDPQIPVGRINVNNSITASNVNEKLRKYIETPLDPAIWGSMVAIADHGDTYAHLNQTEVVKASIDAQRPGFVTTLLPVAMTALQGGRAVMVTEQAINALQEGRGVFNYSGHGHSTSFSDSKVWTIGNASSTSYFSRPIAILSTCCAFTYDKGAYDIASQMVTNTEGGSIASIGANRMVYLVYNTILNNAMSWAYSSSAPGATLGDMFLRGRIKANSMSSSRGQALANHLCFNLFGDPLMPLKVPEYNVEITEVGGRTTYVPDSPCYVKPGSTLTVRGRIVDLQGNPVTDFNGPVKLQLMDGVEQQNALVQEGPSQHTSTFDHLRLATYGAQVVNGEFTADLYITLGRHNNDLNRLIVTATDDRGRGAIGQSNNISVHTEGLVLNPYEPSQPIVTDIYLNDPTFRNGDEFQPNEALRLYASARMDAGMASADKIIGSVTRVSIDGRLDLNTGCIRNTIDEKGRFAITADLPQLDYGRHIATLTVVDNIGRRSDRSVTFTVVPVDIPVEVNVAENTARTSATIDATVSDGADTNRMIIEDCTGKVVYNAQNVSFPHQWNLTDMDGAKVPDGNYNVTVLVSNRRGNGAANTTLTVVK